MRKKRKENKTKDKPTQKLQFEFEDPESEYVAGQPELELMHTALPVLEARFTLSLELQLLHML